MRFYLPSWVGSGSVDNAFRPTVGDGSWAAIDLRPDATHQEGRTLLATSEPLGNVPAGVVDLGDDLDDRSPAVRKALGSHLSLTLDNGSLRGMIAELLILHGDRKLTGRSRWRALTATHDGRHRIRMLGETIYDAPAPLLATIADDWIGVADGTNINNNLTWTEVAGDWSVLTQRLQRPGANSIGHSVRADSDLDTADHYAESAVEFAANGSDWGGPAVRFSSSAATYYLGAIGPRNDRSRIRKVISGSNSELAQQVETAFGGGTYVVRTEVNGSAIDVSSPGLIGVSTTDTDITGNLRCGLGARRDNVEGVFFVDFEAGDLTSAITVAVNPATEAELAQPIAPLISRQVAVGQTTEAESAQPVTPLISRVVPVGQAVEVETANLVSPSTARQVAVGQATEAEAANPITPVIPRDVTVGQASEAETANPITPLSPKDIPVGQAAEREIANSITPSIGRIVIIGAASEAELAQPITPLVGRNVLIGQAAEVELARAISPDKPIFVPVQTALERELARVITVFAGEQFRPEIECAVITLGVACEVTDAYGQVH